MGNKPPIIDAEFEVITGPNEPQPSPEPPQEWNGVGFPPDWFSPDDHPLMVLLKKGIFLALMASVMIPLAIIWRRVLDWLFAAAG